MKLFISCPHVGVSSVLTDYIGGIDIGIRGLHEHNGRLSDFF